MTRARKITLRILFAAVVLLLISYILVEKFYPEQNRKPKVSQEEADTLIRNVLSENGIEKEWIKRTGNIYKVRLPVDVPAEIIMLDLKDRVSSKNVSIEGRELSRRSNSVMDLYSGRKKLSEIKFSYDNGLQRKSAEVSFILFRTEGLSEKETEDLIVSSIAFSMALVPSISNRWLADSLARSGREYSLLINDKIDELQYRLDDKFSDKKLRITIETIVKHFPMAGYYLLENVSNQYSPRVNSLLINELNKRGLKHRDLNEIKYIDASVPLNSRIKMGTKALMLIDASEFIKMQGELKMLRKKGIKIVNSSSIGI